MTRAMVVLVTLAMCASAQSFTGTIEATFVQVEDGVQTRWDSVVVVDGDRWREEITYYGERVTAKGTLPERVIRTVHGDEFQQYAPEFNVLTIHGGALSPHVQSRPISILAYQEADGASEVGLDDVTIYFTKVSLDKPDPAAFAIRPDPSTRTETYSTDERGETARMEQLTNYSCSVVIQEGEIKECEWPGYCTGYYEYYYERWGCEVAPSGECFSDWWWPRVDECPCRWSYYQNACQYGTWHTYYMGACR